MKDLFGKPEIYVDELFYAVSRNPGAFQVGEKTGHKWCHMWPSEVSAAGEAALHEMAAEIGMKRSWFQETQSAGVGRFPHYDLTPGKRAMAIRAGAKAVCLQDWLRGTYEQKLQTSNPKLQGSIKPQAEPPGELPECAGMAGAVRRAVQAKLF